MQIDAAGRRVLSRWVDRLGLRRAVFRTREWLISRHDRRTGSAEGPPSPSAYLRTLVVGTPDLDWFMESGERDAAEFLRLLAEEGGRPLERSTTLEWGCGCGRLSRWIAPRAGTFLGVDVNARLIRWCSAHLPGDYRRIDPSPPLDLADGVVDLIYGCSVLTHLREATAEAWLAELGRLLKPGGRALLTFHDPVHPGAAGLQDALAATGWAVRFDDLEGSNNLAAYTTADRLAELAPSDMRLLRYVPSTQSTSLQALTVFGKALGPL